MNTLLRAGLGAFLGLTLVFGTAFAIEYDDIFEMTANGDSDEAIVRLIIEDGRGFELSAREMDDLRDAGVSDIVIDAMRDPELGRDWLAGDHRDDYDDDDNGRYDDSRSGYSTSLDEAYGQGYSDGRTSLVFSFGYYYGPLSRYYYDDPFYYSFWSAGYAYSYWPSYYAYWYRPAYAWSYAYPYNYYTYDSYYCHTYYDPGYWSANGYTTLPGYGRTVWDDGPRWRDGGIAPPKGGRPNAATALTSRLRDGTGTRARNPVPAIREAMASRTPSQRRANDLDLPTTRKPGDRAANTRLREVAGGRAPERGTVARGDGQRTRSVREVIKGRAVRTSPARGERVVRGTRSTPHVERGTPRIQERAGRREATQRSVQRGREWSGREDRIERREAPEQRPSQEARRSQVRERVRGESRREAPRADAPRREQPRVEAPPREAHGHVEQALPPRQQEAPPPP
ncbi:MAG: hypothetical protein ABIP29_09760, partial [Candidatus Eisenbacteria bacterium]